MLAKESTLQFHGKVVDVFSEIVELPNGKSLEIDKVCHPGGSAVVALDDDGRVCLLRQYRCVLDPWVWELPAGKIDHNEPPFETAKRELREEAGVTAEDWTELGAVLSSPGVFTERVHLYLARVLSINEPEQEECEIMEMSWLPMSEAISWCDNNKIDDGKTLVALYRAAHFMAEK